MAKFLRKALGLIVELAPPASDASSSHTTAPVQNKHVQDQTAGADQGRGGYVMREEDLEKFESHFDLVLSEANMPGPDYYEFARMMDTLETAVPDEATRIQAVYELLSIQGLSKDKLIESAARYKDVLNLDRISFEGALNSRSVTDVDAKKQRSADLARRMTDNSAMIQKLTQEIADAQAEIERLKQDINEAQAKLDNNKQGYTLAHQAMTAKIDQDIDKIKNTIK